MIEGERKKRIERYEQVNVLVVELEREKKKSVIEKTEVEARNLRVEVDRLKRKGEEVSIRPKNRVEGGGRSGIEHVRLNNVRA